MQPRRKTERETRRRRLRQTPEPGQRERAAQHQQYQAARGEGGGQLVALLAEADPAAEALVDVIELARVRCREELAAGRVCDLLQGVAVGWHLHRPIAADRVGDLDRRVLRAERDGVYGHVQLLGVARGPQ